MLCGPALMTMIIRRLFPLLLIVLQVINASNIVIRETDLYDSNEDGENVTKNYDSYFAEYEYMSSANSTFILRKCFCDLNEVWNGTTCEETDEISDEYLNILDYNAAIGSNNVLIEETCPQSNVQIEFSFNTYERRFHIQHSGELVLDGYVFEKYCIESYKSARQPVNWIIKICFDSPTIPTCCPEGQTLDKNGFCTTTWPYEFSPPVDILHEIVQWPPNTNIKMTNISCAESEESFISKLDNKTLVLYYDQYQQTPLWTPSLYIENSFVNTNYCIGIASESDKISTYVAKFCYRDQVKDHEIMCHGKTCIRKCCQKSDYYNQGCVTYPDNGTEFFSPTFHDPADFTVSSEPEDLNIVYGQPLCSGVFQMVRGKNDDDEFFLLNNGYLYSEVFPEPYPPTKYCVESYQSSEIGMALVCFQTLEKTETACPSIQKHLYPLLLVVSIGFLGITLLVYFCVPELHARVQGCCILSHVSALLMAFITLLIVQKVSVDVNHHTCTFLASLMQVSFLAAFFWLNVMCFDIWWTLRNMGPSPERGESSRLRFRLYSLYSWGCPLLISIFSVIIQSLPDGVDIIRPGFGWKTCWFDSKKSKWAYFYGIILVLITANILFFCHVAYILIAQQHDSILQRTRQQNLQRMWLYVKLFIVMGITWLAEVISWHEGSCEEWIFTDIINSLQGVFIFLIYICNKYDLRKVRDRLETMLRQLKAAVRSAKFCPIRPSKIVPRDNGEANLQDISSSTNEHKAKDATASANPVQKTDSYVHSTTRTTSTISLTVPVTDKMSSTSKENSDFSSSAQITDQITISVKSLNAKADTSSKGENLEKILIFHKNESNDTENPLEGNDHASSDINMAIQGKEDSNSICGDETIDKLYKSDNEVEYGKTAKDDAISD